jgi:peptide/nickel transport system permease protein
MISAFSRLWQSDVAYSFRTSPVAVGAALVALVCVFCSVFAGIVAPHNPFDLATLELSDARLPPAWSSAGSSKYLLGTDDQGRDILSALMYGARISLAVGFASVVLSVVIGVALGLVAGFYGGWIDSTLMRLCDVMLSFPAILVALLIAGVGRALFPNAQDSLALGVLIVSITLTGWVQYARTVRGSTLVERNKEYVQAARVTGVTPMRIMRRHVLPNVMGPVLVLATIQVATAIITEATLSFLGVGAPPNGPACPGPNPAGCRETGCGPGMVCDTRAACRPSSCACTANGWTCTSDCGGGVCRPANLPRPRPRPLPVTE